MANIKTVEMFKGGECIIVNDTEKDIKAWTRQGYSIQDSVVEPKTKNEKIAALKEKSKDTK